MNVSTPVHPSPEFWPIDWSLPSGVHAVCTTRVGGASEPPYGSWNLGDHVGDDPSVVAQNRAILQSHLGGGTPIFLSQVHGTNVTVLTPQTPHGTVADACLSVSSQLACTIMVADCLPLLFTDDQGLAVAAAHAGWRGLAAGVIEKTVHALCLHAHAATNQLRVWLGPCIGPQAFEVGHDVKAAFTSSTVSPSDPPPRALEACFQPHMTHKDKWFADLAGLARLRLQALGVTAIAGNDSSAAWCTVSQPSRLFSFRRDGVTGRFAVCIWRS